MNVGQIDYMNLDVAEKTEDIYPLPVTYVSVFQVQRALPCRNGMRSHRLLRS